MTDEEVRTALARCPETASNHQALAVIRGIIDFRDGCWVMADSGKRFGPCVIEAPLGPNQPEDGSGWQSALVWPGEAWPIIELGTFVHEEKAAAMEMATKFAVWLSELHQQFNVDIGASQMRSADVDYIFRAYYLHEVSPEDTAAAIRRRRHKE